MLRNLVAVFVFLTSLAIFVPSVNAGYDAYTTADVNMRTGPSSRYAIILAIPRGESVYVRGCLAGRNWCDVEWFGHQGYVYGRYLAGYSQGYRQYYEDAPYIILEFDRYRDRVYKPKKKRKFYKKRKKRKSYKKKKKRKKHKSYKKRKKRKVHKKSKKRKSYKKRKKRKSYKKRKKRKKRKKQRR